MAKYYQTRVHVLYRWIYGVLALLYLLINKSMLYVQQGTPEQALLAVGLFFSYFFIVNLLFSAWVVNRKHTEYVIILGIALDLTLAAGFSYLLGFNNILALFLFSIPLFFSAHYRNFNYIVYALTVAASQMVLFLHYANPDGYYLFNQYVGDATTSLLVITISFAVIRFLAYRSGIDATNRSKVMAHELRNSLTAIMGYLNLINNEEISDELKFQYFQKLESVVVGMKELSDYANISTAQLEEVESQRKSKHVTANRQDFEVTL